MNERCAIDIYLILYGYGVPSPLVRRNYSPRPNRNHARIADPLGLGIHLVHDSSSDNHSPTKKPPSGGLFVIAFGGGGGNRTPVRKHSALGPTCLVSSLI